jgi:hypothetical protein
MDAFLEVIRDEIGGWLPIPQQNRSTHFHLEGFS